MSALQTHESDVLALRSKAKDHLWLHMSRQSRLEDKAVTPLPIIERGLGHHVLDVEGKRYIDGLSGLFAVNVGHGRQRIVDVAAEQMERLAYFPIWSAAHPGAIELAARLAEHAPGDLNRVFFTSGGSEAVESAIKLAKQFWRLTGKPGKYKVLSRATAYHGTTHGALAVTGIPAMKQEYEPVAPGGFRVPNTNFYRAAEYGAPETIEEFGIWAADRIEEMILFEGEDTVAAVFLEPLQNSGGCFVAPPGYFERVREICDKHDVLLVSDEVICGFGRVGSIFACDSYGYVPDIITCAKGITSGYAPLGAMIASERLYEPFGQGDTSFAHGYTFGGHPVSTAVALENLSILEEEDLPGRVRGYSADFRAELQTLATIPIVGDIRGDGYFFAIELVSDQATKRGFSAEESERLLRGYLATELLEAGLYCRTDDRGDAVIQLAPPLTIGPDEFREISAILRDVLGRASELL